MKIYILHGKDLSPKDPKLILLQNIAKNRGHEVVMIDDSDTKDPNKRAKRFLDRLQTSKEEVIIAGSSMGGYVAIWASSFVRVKGLFLLSPALDIQGYDRFNLPLKCDNMVIVHGLADTVVPIENSIDFAKKTNTPLHAVTDTHSLTNSHVELQSYFETFLDNID